MAKEKAINVGIELFSKKGYSNVGLAEILTTANIPKGSFYHHFKSKEDFAIQVLEKYSGYGLSQFRDVLLNKTELTPKQRIIEFYTNAITTHESMNYEKGCLLGDSCSDGGVSNDYKGFVSQQLNKWQTVIELCLDEAKQLGQLNEKSDTRMLAAVILNGWEGAMSRMKIMKSRQPLDDFLNSLDILIPNQ